MPKTLLTISVVIGSNESLIIPCLASICQGTKSKFDIYVVSNQSSAEIVNEIKRQFPAVNIVLNSSCKGFAENHNYVMECSDSEYVLILNDDTLLPDGSIDKLTEFMEKNKKIGVVSPKLINPDGSLQPSTYRFPNLITIFLGLSGLRSSIHPTETVLRLVNLVEKSFGLKGKSRLWKHDYTTEVDTFKGACTLVRRKAINEVGLMDEVTLFYGEETEWHYRFKKRGWKVIFYPEIQIIHFGQESIKRQEDLRIRFEEIKGLLNIYRKHHNQLSYLLLRVMIGFIFSLKYLISKVKRGASREKMKLYYAKILQSVISPNKFFEGKRVYYD